MLAQELIKVVQILITTSPFVVPIIMLAVLFKKKIRLFEKYPIYWLILGFLGCLIVLAQFFLKKLTLFNVVNALFLIYITINCFLNFFALKKQGRKSSK